MSVTAEQFKAAASMEELYGLLEKAQMENGWNKPEPSIYPRPKKPFTPAHWPYGPAKGALDAAGRFVNTKLAERRNLILANPVKGNRYPTVQTLVAAYQMVKAGECARSHRHTANALRFVIETGPGAYTIVDGKKIPMEAGDVLLTPNWLWHGHQNESTEDAYWMDFLDVPLVHLLGPMFFEQHPEEIEKTDIVAADSPCRFAWSDTIQRLNDATELAPGIREIELGAPALDTIALHVRRLDPGATMEVEASTLSAIHAVMQGNGTMAADGKTFEWGRGDAIAMPSSTAASWSAQSESYLLQVSDKPLLEKLNWLRPIEN